MAQDSPLGQVAVAQQTPSTQCDDLHCDTSLHELPLSPRVSGVTVFVAEGAGNDGTVEGEGVDAEVSVATGVGVVWAVADERSPHPVVQLKETAAAIRKPARTTGLTMMPPLTPRSIRRPPENWQHQSERAWVSRARGGSCAVDNGRTGAG